MKLHVKPKLTFLVTYLVFMFIFYFFVIFSDFARHSTFLSINFCYHVVGCRQSYRMHVCTYIHAACIHAACIHAASNTLYGVIGDISAVRCHFQFIDKLLKRMPTCEI